MSLIEQDQSGFLTGKLLVAMPHIDDARFANAVIYVCGHDDSGAMGLVVNRRIETLGFDELLEQLDLTVDPINPDFPINYGGPVEIGRGFVLHGNDYYHDSTVEIDDEFSLTATLDVLTAIALGEGPQQSLLALGYTGWSEGQLEQEIQHNDWIIIDPTPELLFNGQLEAKWRQALDTIGVDPAIMSIETGRA